MTVKSRASGRITGSQVAELPAMPCTSSSGRARAGRAVAHVVAVDRADAAAPLMARVAPVTRSAGPEATDASDGRRESDRAGSERRSAPNGPSAEAERGAPIDGRGLASGARAAWPEGPERNHAMQSGPSRTRSSANRPLRS